MNKYGLPKHIVEIENHVGHWKIGTGASSILDEVRECRKIASRVHEILLTAKVPSTYFQDDISTTKSANLKRIVDHHNADINGLVMAYHLNASSGVKEDGIGTEVIYANDKWKPLAEAMSLAIAKAGGFKNRGAKKRTNLYVLNGTKEPAILLEVFFVNSKIDTALYQQKFESICRAIASVCADTLGKSLNVASVENTNTAAYRLYTGTYQTKNKAENALKSLQSTFKWTAYLEQIGTGWRVKTGTFKGHTVAHEAAEKIKKAKIASVVHVKNA